MNLVEEITILLETSEKYRIIGQEYMDVYIYTHKWKRFFRINRGFELHRPQLYQCLVSKSSEIPVQVNEKDVRK